MSKRTVEISTHVVHATEAALACKLDPNDEKENTIWVPKSLVENLDQLGEIKFGQMYELEVQEWFAEQEGMI